MKLRAFGDGLYTAYVERGPWGAKQRFDLTDSETGGRYVIDLRRLLGGGR